MLPLVCFLTSVFVFSCSSLILTESLFTLHSLYTQYHSSTKKRGRNLDVWTVWVEGYGITFVKLWQKWASLSS